MLQETWPDHDIGSIISIKLWGNTNIFEFFFAIFWLNYCS